MKKITIIISIFFTFCMATLGQIKNATDSVYVTVEKMPQFPGGEAELYRHLSQKVVFPQNTGYAGQRITIRYIITKNGKIEDIKITRSTGFPDIDSAYVNAVREMPDWIPAEHKGKKVDVYYVLPIHIRPKADPPLVRDYSNIHPNIPIVVNDTIQKMGWSNKPDVHPLFPGGRKGFIDFFENNTKYPIIAIENGIGGFVTIGFVVTRTGEIDDVRVAKGIDAACDREAVRVVKAMPKWIPAQVNGKNIDSEYSVTIFFNKNYVRPKGVFTTSPRVPYPTSHPDETMGDIISGVDFTRIEYLKKINKEISKLRYYKPD